MSNFILPIQPGETFSLSTTVDPGYIDLVAAIGSVGQRRDLERQ